MNDGGPAFPTGPTDNWTARGPDGGVGHLSDYGWEGQPGMSLRDYFAAKAMAALLTIPSCGSCEEAARYAYRAADAMLAARGSGPTFEEPGAGGGGSP